MTAPSISYANETGRFDSVKRTSATAWRLPAKLFLGVIFLANAGLMVASLGLYWSAGNDALGQADWYVLVQAVFAGWNMLFAVGVLARRRVAFYGFFATALAAAGADFVIGTTPLLPAIAGGGIGVLWVLLQLGRPSLWSQLSD